jgi:hypothetical protein
MKYLLFLAPLAFAIPPPAPTPPPQHQSPIIDGQPWRVHDMSRPYPPQITPSNVPGGPPSDAIILFDGHNLDAFKSGKGLIGPYGPPTWHIIGNEVECDPGKGDLVTKEKFGDIQLHLEWRSPTPPTGSSQGRGNSGVILMGRYEIQVLDSWDNPTYPDGEAGAIYSQWPPMVAPTKHPGEWNTYDIFFEAPRMDGDKLLKPAYVTVVYNGVLVQNHMAISGPTAQDNSHYTATPAEDVFFLQDHHNTVRYRNIWVRRLAPRDAPLPK